MSFNIRRNKLLRPSPRKGRQIGIEMSITSSSRIYCYVRQEGILLWLTPNGYKDSYENSPTGRRGNTFRKSSGMSATVQSSYSNKISKKLKEIVDSSSSFFVQERNLSSKYRYLDDCMVLAWYVATINILFIQSNVFISLTIMTHTKTQTLK